MKKIVLIGMLVLIGLAVNAQSLSAVALINLVKTHSLYAADSTIKALGYAYPPTHKDGILPVIYDMVNWDSKALKFPNRYEVSNWKASTDSTFTINFVTADTVQFNKLIDEFVAEKFVRTPYGDKSINKDYKSEKYPGILMRIQYNRLLDMGPNKIGVYYSWK